MGLAERRVQKDFQDNHFPKLKKEVDAAAHLTIPLEVKWDTLAPEGQSHLFVDSWTKVYFQPLVAALKNVCRDDMGREAVKEKLKKVVMQNTQENYSASRWAAFENGVLTLDHQPCTNVDDIDDRAKGIIDVLEKAL